MIQSRAERNAKRRANYHRNQLIRPRPVFQCTRCGKAVSRKRGEQKFCAVCRKVADCEWAAAKREKTRIRYKRNCVVCRGTFETNMPNQKSCDSCHLQYRKLRNYERAKIRLRTDPQFALVALLRRRINNALAYRGVERAGRFRELVGCSKAQLVAHIEKKFRPGMTWESRGIRGWHIDHIVPCSRFDLTTLEEQKRCFHYTNLQPLWYDENVRKSNRLSGPLLPPTSPLPPPGPAR
jgi:hypothetical protein